MVKKQSEDTKAEAFPDKPVDTRNIQQRIWAAQEHCNYVQKDQAKASPNNENKGQQFSTMSHEGTTMFAKPFLHKQRIIVVPNVLESSQDGNKHWSRVDTRFVNIDNPEDFESCITEASFVSNQGAGPSSCLSLCIKQALLKTLMIATGEKEETEMVDYEPDKQPMTEGESMKKQLYNEVKFHIQDLGLDQKKISMWCMEEFDGKMVSEVNADTLDFIIEAIKKNKDDMFSKDEE